MDGLAWTEFVGAGLRAIERSPSSCLFGDVTSITRGDLLVITRKKRRGVSAFWLLTMVRMKSNEHLSPHRAQQITSN